MTVQELINQLETIKDKSKIIEGCASYLVEGYNEYGYYVEKDNIELEFDNITEDNKVLINFTKK